MKRTLFFFLAFVWLHQAYGQDAPEQEPQLAYLNSLGTPMAFFTIGSSIKYKRYGDTKFSHGYITEITPDFVYISGIPLPYEQLRKIRRVDSQVTADQSKAVGVTFLGLLIMGGGSYFVVTGDLSEAILGIFATAFGAVATAIGIAWLADGGGTVTANRSHRFAYWEPHTSPSEDAPPSEQLPTNPEPAPSNTDIPRLATNFHLNSALFPYAELRWLHSHHMESYMGFSRGAAGVGFKVGTSIYLRKYQKQAFLPAIHARLGAWTPTVYADSGPVIGPYGGLAIDRQMKGNVFWGIEAGLWYAATENYLLPVTSVKLGIRFGKKML